jgi:PKD repeat protein
MRVSVVPVVAVVTAVAALSGCAGGRYESDFPVVVVNRTANTIQALANGNAMGQVTAGQTQSFTLKLPESNANVFSNGTAPTPQADVTFTARDARTGALSTEKSMTISQANPTYVSFTADDFPSTGPTIANFTFSPTNPIINQDVSFNGSSSRVSNGTYEWDFGDGQSGTGVATTHRYTSARTFTVTLKVTSDTRATSTQSRTINVSATLPPATANFTFSPRTPSINQDVTFIAISTTPGGPGGAVTYAWEFGDSTSGSGPTVTHRYTRAGTFGVLLRATNDSGITATTSQQITITANLQAGSANFVFSPTDPQPGDVIFFNASSSTATNPSYSWDFGDGTSATGVAPTHTYTLARTFAVTLTVRNELGQTASVSKTITVTNPAMGN